MSIQEYMLMTVSCGETQADGLVKVRGFQSIYENKLPTIRRCWWGCLRMLKNQDYPKSCPQLPPLGWCGTEHRRLLSENGEIQSRKGVNKTSTIVKHPEFSIIFMDWHQWPYLQRYWYRSFRNQRLDGVTSARKKFWLLGNASNPVKRSYRCFVVKLR